MGGAVVTGTTVDASNVIDELGKVVDHVAANKASLLDKEDFHIYVSNSIYQAYVRALGGFGANGLGGNGYEGRGNSNGRWRRFTI